MTHTLPPDPDIGDAARLALETAQRTNRRYEDTFEGVLLIAYPNDTMSHVLERWGYERKLVELGYKGA